MVGLRVGDKHRKMEKEKKERKKERKKETPDRYNTTVPSNASGVLVKVVYIRKVRSLKMNDVIPKADILSTLYFSG